MKSPREILASFLHPTPPNPTRPVTQRVIGRRGIRVREGLAYILAFALAVVMVGVFLRWHVGSLYKQEMAYWRARQSSVADNQAQRVSDWLRERQEDAHVLATYSSIRAVLRAYYGAGQLPKQPSGSLPELVATLDNLARFYPYAGVYVLDRDARVVAQSSRSVPLGPSLNGICRAVAHSAVMRIDLVGDAPNRSLMGFSAPVLPGLGATDAGQRAGQLLGIVLLVCDASQTLFPLVTREVVPTPTGETLLVRHEGNDIVFFSPLRHVPAGSPNLHIPLSTAPRPARLALEGRETFVEYNDYRGVPVLAATQHIPLTDWGLVRKIDRAEAMEGFRRIAIGEGMAAGLLLIILLGGLLIFHRRDVTTRVLKQEEEKFRTLLESAPDAIYIIEPSTLRILRRNRRAAEMDGYSDEEIAHMSTTDLYPSEERHLLRERFGNISETGLALPFYALHHWRKDGQLVPIEERQTLVEAGGERFVLSFVRDITEREQAEQALRGSEQFIREIVANVREGITVYDPEFRYKVWNHFMEQMTGVPASEVLGKHAFDLFPHLREQKVDLVIRRALAGEVVQTPDMPFRVPTTGKSGWFSSIYAPHFGASGEIIGVIGIIRDITERKRTEIVLQESEERYRSLIENATVGIYRTTPQGRILMANTTLVKMLGYEHFAELAARNLEEEGFEAGYPRRAFREQIERDGEVKGLEAAWTRRDGSVIFVRESARVVRDESGNVLCYDGIVEDITERKRAEQMLREYEKVVEGSNDMIAVVDRKYRYLLANRAYLDQRGLEREELLGSSVPEVLGEEAFESVAKEKLDECFQGRTVRYEMKDQYPKLGERDILVSCFPIEGPHGVDRAACVLQDITERKQAEQALIEERHLLHTLMDNLPDRIYFKDRESRFTRINKAVAKSFGLSNPAQAVGKTDSDFFTGEHAQQAYADEQEIIRTGQPVVGKEEMETWPDGHVTWVSTTKMPLRDANGNIIGTFGVSRDITERKGAEVELQRSRDQLRALAARVQTVREEERTKSAREIHDELGQALTAIRIDLSSLIRGLPADKKQQSESILKLVDETIHFVRRISTELRPPILDAVGLVAAVEWAAEEFEARTGISCQLDIPQDDVVNEGERATALFRIFQEALTNVARHSSATEVNVRLAKEDGNVILQVRDNGKGVSEEQLSADSSLGILGMRERALLLGGELTITGALGKGTTVRVRIPETHSTPPKDGK